MTRTLSTNPRNIRRREQNRKWREENYSAYQQIKKRAAKRHKEKRVKAVKSNPHYFRDQRLARHFGMELGDYDKMLTAQNGVCAICKKPPLTKPLNVDHCHKSGKVRGLLCVKCNTHLGFVEKHLGAITSYLRYYYREVGDE